VSTRHSPDGRTADRLEGTEKERDADARIREVTVAVKDRGELEPYGEQVPATVEK
jgi:hypothetical protein